MGTSMDGVANQLFGAPVYPSTIPDCCATQQCGSECAAQQCAICFENVIDHERVLPCGHKFHEGCLAPWLESHDTCPLCRAKVSAECPETSTQPGQVQILEEHIAEDYEPTESEVQEYAEWIGVDLISELHLMPLCVEALKALLPEHWKLCRSVEGDIFYFNFQTGESLWDHPCDEHYRTELDRERERHRLRQQQQERHHHGQQQQQGPRREQVAQLPTPPTVLPPHREQSHRASTCASDAPSEGHTPQAVANVTCGVGRTVIDCGAPRLQVQHGCSQRACGMHHGHCGTPAAVALSSAPDDIDWQRVRHEVNACAIGRCRALRIRSEVNSTRASEMRAELQSC